MSNKLYYDCYCEDCARVIDLDNKDINKVVYGDVFSNES